MADVLQSQCLLLTFGTLGRAVVLLTMESAVHVAAIELLQIEEGVSIEQGITDFFWASPTEATYKAHASHCIYALIFQTQQQVVLLVDPVLKGARQEGEVF